MSDTLLYRIYGPQNVLIYVGITNDYDKRMSQHSEKFWWREVRRITTAKYSTRKDAAIAETAAIRDEAPKYNRTHAATTPPRPHIPRPSKPGERRLVSLAEAAGYLGVHPRTIRRRIADSSITGYRVGRLIKVDLADLDALAAPIPTHF